MAYIGPEPKLGRNREVDDISSGFNGSTTAFTLAISDQMYLLELLTILL